MLATLLACVLAAPGASAQSGAVTIAVDAAAARHAITPLVYCVSYADSATVADLNLAGNRLGATPASTYNWQQNADNKGDDFYFESEGYPSATPGEYVDTFIDQTRAGGATPLITIPIMGRVAKLDPGRATTWSFSVAKYGAQTAADPGNADAGNGVLPGDVFVLNDPDDASVAVDVAFQQGWVQHLIDTWGTAGSGGLRYYLLDNEPGIWHVSHRDVHPTGAGMDDVFARMRDHAAMIKTLDPSALTVGPEEWNWWGYFISGFDTWSADVNGDPSEPDRQAHGGQDYIPWLLDQFRANEQATGTRLLDVLSVHYYPKANEFLEDGSPPDVTEPMQLLRNRSTRSLWDPAYVEEGLIADTVRLIPRLKEWVAAHYPGTRIAVNEYSWSAEDHINGATTQADILGILGREAPDQACRWLAPGPATPTYQAMKLYRNYDGQKSTFGTTSVSATTPDPDWVSAFAALRWSDSALTVVVVGKHLPTTSPPTVNATVTLAGFTTQGPVEVWQMTAANGGAIGRLGDLALSGGSVALTLPAQSVTLLVARGIAAATFADVPPSHLFFPFVERLYAAGVTGGCATSPLAYCPDSPVTRGQMAVFLLKAAHGPTFVPPPAAGVFADVPSTDAFAPWIERLHAEGVTGGCATSPLRYCPSDPVTREQMAVFLLKAVHGSAYAPPAAAGIFADVPAGDLFAPWIERLYAEGVTGGCATSPLQYCPADPVTRGQMAVFLVRAFGLP
jgi:hypothetical protein